MDIGGVHSLLIQGFEEKVQEEIRNIGEEILLHTITDLLDERDHVSSSYISSNSILEDRMGSVISMLTTYGITVEGARNALHIEPLSDTLGSKKPFPLIITPKRVAKARSKILQRIYELLTVLHTIGSEEKIFFNWNYNRFIGEMNTVEETLLSRLIQGENIDIEKDLIHMVERYLINLIKNIRGNIPLESPHESFKYLVDLLPKAYNDLFELIASMKIFANDKFDDIIDYTTIVVEKSMFEILLYDLLERAKRSHVDVFWITSNPDDNYISRINHVLSWINDTVLLTHVWRNLGQAVLNIRDIVKEYLVDEGKGARHSTLRFVYKIHENLPTSKYSYMESSIQLKKGLWYAKFSPYGPIIQLVYIGEYKNSTIIEGLEELFTVSDKRSGYPRPLILVRRACRISDKVARGLGDSLLRRINNPLLRVILRRESDVTIGAF